MSLLDEARQVAKTKQTSPACQLAKQVMEFDPAKQQEVFELLRSEVGNAPVTAVLNRHGVAIAETTVRSKRVGGCKCEWCQENWVNSESD